MTEQPYSVCAASSSTRAFSRRQPSGAKRLIDHQSVRIKTPDRHIHPVATRREGFRVGQNHLGHGTSRTTTGKIPGGPHRRIGPPGGIARPARTKGDEKLNISTPITVPRACLAGWPALAQRNLTDRKSTRL